MTSANCFAVYGVSKLAIENYLTLFRDLRGLGVAPRIGNPYGPKQTMQRNFGAVATFAMLALKASRSQSMETAQSRGTTCP